MEAMFKLSINEMDSIFLDRLKTMFPENSIIEIKISDEYDETDYLLSTPSNRESLRRSIEQFNKNELIIKTQEELKL
ncbi:MAG: hypothetical protein ABRQ37_15260 [Candidatus Eremiobacterota bacterium]